MMNHGEYSFHKLDTSHYPLLKELYADAFGSAISLEKIQQRFDTASLGSPVIAFIAIHSATGKPAAYYGVFPVKAIVNKDVIQIAQSGDTMTHSQHRKKGLFTKLAQLTYDECSKAGIKFVFGQPNEQSYHGFMQSLNWKHIDDIVRWDLKLSTKTLPIPKISQRLGVFESFYLPYAKSVLKPYTVNDITSFTNPLKGEQPRIHRDKNYLNYKRSENKFFLKVEGINLWVSLTDIFWIGDLGNYENITPSFVKKIKQIAFRLGYNTISLNFNRSIQVPQALSMMVEYSHQASGYFYIDKSYEGTNLILTAADSDSW